MGKLNAFSGYHPAALFCYFISVLVVTMFTANPVLLLCSLTGSTLFYLSIQSFRQALTDAVFNLVLFIMIAVTNPLFSHNGVNPLFFLNGNPVTLEAVLYGINISVMLISVLYWCKCYSRIMTSDKFMYLFGKTIPKLSLILSMSLRFIPLYKRQMKKISKAQKGLGIYSSQSYTDRIRGAVRIFSALVSWSLENAVETGNSMKARGYGLKGRTNYNLFSFKGRDASLLGISLLLLFLVLFGIASGKAAFYFYPKISDLPAGGFSYITYAAFALLSFIPFIFEIKETLKWKYYVSKI